MIDNFVPPASSSSLRVSQRVMAKNEALYAFVYVFVQCAVMMVSPGTLCFCGSGFTQTDMFLQRMALTVLRCSLSVYLCDTSTCFQIQRWAMVARNSNES